MIVSMRAPQVASGSGVSTLQICCAASTGSGAAITPAAVALAFLPAGSRPRTPDRRAARRRTDRAGSAEPPVTASQRQAHRV